MRVQYLREIASQIWQQRDNHDFPVYWESGYEFVVEGGAWWTHPAWFFEQAIEEGVKSSLNGAFHTALRCTPIQDAGRVGPDGAQPSIVQLSVKYTHHRSGDWLPLRTAALALGGQQQGRLPFVPEPFNGHLCDDSVIVTIPGRMFLAWLVEKGLDGRSVSNVARQYFAPECHGGVCWLHTHLAEEFVLWCADHQGASVPPSTHECVFGVMA